MAAPPSSSAVSRDWSFQDALSRWRAFADSELPSHGAIPFIDNDIGCSVSCSCGFRGKGLDWLKHLNEAVHNAVKD